MAVAATAASLALSACCSMGPPGLNAADAKDPGEEVIAPTVWHVTNTVGFAIVPAAGTAVVKRGRSCPTVDDDTSTEC